MDPEERLDKYVCEGFDVAKVDTTETAETDDAHPDPDQQHDALPFSVYEKESNLNTVFASLVKYLLPVVAVFIIFLVVAYGRSNFGLKGSADSDTGKKQVNEKGDNQGFQPELVTLKTTDDKGSIRVDLHKTDYEQLKRISIYFPESYSEGPIEFDRDNIVESGYIAFILPFPQIRGEIITQMAAIESNWDVKVRFPIMLEYVLFDNSIYKNKVYRKIQYYVISLEKKTIKEIEYVKNFEIEYSYSGGNADGLNENPQTELETLWEKSKKTNMAYWFKKLKIRDELIRQKMEESKKSRENQMQAIEDANKKMDELIRQKKLDELRNSEETKNFFDKNGTQINKINCDKKNISKYKIVELKVYFENKENDGDDSQEKYYRGYVRCDCNSLPVKCYKLEKEKSQE